MNNVLSKIIQSVYVVQVSNSWVPNQKIFFFLSKKLSLEYYSFRVFHLLMVH